MPMQTCTWGTPARSAAARDASSADSRRPIGRHARRRDEPGTRPGRRSAPNTSRRTRSSASSNVRVGRLAMTGPMSSGGASANGSWATPRRDRGGERRGSGHPDLVAGSAKPAANGSSGPKWPSLAVVAHSTRTLRVPSSQPPGNRTRRPSPPATAATRVSRRPASWPRRPAGTSPGAAPRGRRRWRSRACAQLRTSAERPPSLELEGEHRPGVAGRRAGRADVGASLVGQRVVPRVVGVLGPARTCREQVRGPRVEVADPPASPSGCRRDAARVDRRLEQFRRAAGQQQLRRPALASTTSQYGSSSSAG